MRIAVTGGAGFIGSNFVDFILKTYPDDEVIVIDKLTYAGRLENLFEARKSPRFGFFPIDICDLEPELLRGCDVVVNFAAETHVDRSLKDSGEFIRTNVLGVQRLITVCRSLDSIPKFIQVSTDEVYGEKLEGESLETDPLHPRNPYAASKAAAELLLKSYFASFGFPVVIIRGTNNYGPRQHSEKFIPTLIRHAVHNKPLPIYGTGECVREWIYVKDFAAAVNMVMRYGELGEVYNAGGGERNRLTQLEVAKLVLDVLGKPESLIAFVEDRPGHDRRYAVNSEKIRNLGWEPCIRFNAGLRWTVKWYLNLFGVKFDGGDWF
jgi:dTDP-glucose 4,6-dehydratase